MNKPSVQDLNDIGTPYKSITYRKWTPCGNLYITFAMRNEEPGRVEFVRIVSSSKNSPCGSTFFESKADDLSFMIRRIRNIHEAMAIIKNQKHHRCNQYIPNKDKVMSCSDAIGQALEAILLKDEKEKEEKTTQTTT